MESPFKSATQTDRHTGIPNETQIPTPKTPDATAEIPEFGYF